MEVSLKAVESMTCVYKLKGKDNSYHVKDVIISIPRAWVGQSKTLASPTGFEPMTSRTPGALSAELRRD